MRHFAFVFLILGSSLFANTDQYQSSFEVVRNYLESYGEVLTSDELILIKTLPRTGTNLTMAFLNQLTGRYALWAWSKNWTRGVLHNRAHVDVNRDLIPILGSHKPEIFNGLENNRLITCIRDFKEWFPRTVGKDLNYTQSDLKRYMDHLKFIDSWDENLLCIVSFETLLTKPTEVIDQLADFLNASEERRRLLLSDLEGFRWRVLQSYKGHMGSENDGKQIKLHQNAVPAEKLMTLELELRKLNPYLFEKYLSQYSIVGSL